ncbi:flagellar basal body L-ring protein FlgH [Marispirochaeta aestuarii]|uniref:flagellar basal body L-ring protein FlgH n=1 Tax=Marispirochaeta aestuarii TaxID=1963862 RepID=UPI0029C63DC9|nr:flagellar basal body L-ring protein FlgH [Marispirochaeta aestuarii]
MRRLTALLSALILCTALLGADSLVPPDFPGYLSAAGSLQVGDLVGVRIDSDTSMTYTSSFSTAGSVSLTFTGGEGDGLFNFLPSGSSRNQSTADGEEESILSTRLGARIVQIGPSGAFFLRGSRETRIDRAVQRVEIEGWANIRDLDEDATVDFDNLADSVLVFSSFISGDEQVITETDLQRTEEVQAPSEEAPADGQELPLIPEGEEVPEAMNEIPAENLPVETPQAGRAYTFSEDTRRRLLLEYINNMIYLLFSPAE